MNVPGWQTVNDTTPDTYQVPPDWKIENKDSGGVSYVVTEYKLGFCPQDPTGDMANTGTTGGAEGVTDPVKAAQAEEASEFTDPTTQVTTDPAEKTAAGYTLVRMHLTQAAGSDPCPSTKSTFEVVAVPSANGFFLFHIWADQSLPGALPAADIDKIANTFHYSQ